MKFQNPSLIFFLTEGHTHGRKHGCTDKPKPICSPLFQSWGHKKTTDSKQKSMKNYPLCNELNNKVKDVCESTLFHVSSGCKVNNIRM